ncbi:helix-turn-helix domain-containing protein [Cytobacillus solani]|uniref:HTH cro/C1-type domain-containing protein n=1 Tax=Cytobacillus solani TaxID=1637975 RepID=A0A0Q3QSH0_9BACI|nr:helix-turn-helix domain-containing protein [Cytobacillus solani]KQL20504.1 hypothetical protein AN957_19220 [Cytobacillus solani]
MSTLGERLKKARERRGLTQLEAAQKANINNKTLSRYENDGTKPDPEILGILSKVYGVNANYLLGLDEVQQNEEKTQEQIFFRADISNLSKDEKELFKDDIEKYIESRKEFLLKLRKKR